MLFYNNNFLRKLILFQARKRSCFDFPIKTRRICYYKLIKNSIFKNLLFMKVQLNIQAK